MPPHARQGWGGFTPPAPCAARVTAWLAGGRRPGGASSPCVGQGFRIRGRPFRVPAGAQPAPCIYFAMLCIKKQRPARGRACESSSMVNLPLEGAIRCLCVWSKPLSRFVAVQIQPVTVMSGPFWTLNGPPKVDYGYTCAARRLGGAPSRGKLTTAMKFRGDCRSERH